MDNLDIAKQKLNIYDYIPGSKTKKDKYIYVNPCPFCQHKWHFVISRNWYHSFSGCCKGGNVLDWFIEYEKLSSKEASKKILELADINPNNTKKISELNKIKKQTKEIKIQIIKEKDYIKKTYNNLCCIFRILSEIKENNVFLNWLYNFLDNYTNRFILAENHTELFNLSKNLENEFELQYKNFISYEKELVLFLKENHGR